MTSTGRSYQQASVLSEVVSSVGLLWDSCAQGVFYKESFTKLNVQVAFSLMMGIVIHC